MSMHQFAWLTAQPIAHRGLHDLESARPENTLAAFEAAIGGGFAIECDVRLSADQIPIVVHDRSLRRLTGTDGDVAAMSSSQLAALRIAGTNQRIPTLERTLEVVAGRRPLFIEMKREKGRAAAFATATANVLSRYDGLAAIMSFDWRILQQMALCAAERPRGLVAQGGPLVGSYHLHSFWRSRVHFLAYRAEDIPSPFATMMRRTGRPLLTWTVRSGREAERLSHHVDQVIFEGFLPTPPAAPDR